MAHPKRKHSKSRRDKRRTHFKAAHITISNCSNCGAPKLPHNVCPECGYYRGQKVIEKNIL